MEIHKPNLRCVCRNLQNKNWNQGEPQKLGKYVKWLQFLMYYLYLMLYAKKEAMFHAILRDSFEKIAVEKREISRAIVNLRDYCNKPLGLLQQMSKFQGSSCRSCW